MTKITTDFVGSETIAVTKQRLTDILAYWGASTAAYTTWGQARTALNALLTSTTAGTIGSTELAGSFLPKINFLNDPDEMVADALFGAGEQGVWLDPSDVANVAWRRNILLYSESFDNVAWNKLASGTGVAPTVTANYATAPDGAATADRIIFNRGAGTTAGDISRIVQDPPDPASGTPTSSFYVRSTDGVSTYTMRLLNGFTESNITVTGAWQRFSLTSSSTTFNCQLGLIGNANQQTADVLVWGAQADYNSFATEYQRITDLNTEVIERFPNATMYQDFSGTIPVYAPGQPVGLRLDKSRALALGSELVTNGNFSAGITGWLAGASVTASIVSGELQFTGGGAPGSTGNNWVYQTVSGQVFNSRRFQIAFDATWVSGGDLYVASGYTPTNSVTTIAAASNAGVKTRYTRTLTNAIGDNVCVNFAAVSGAVWRLDNISVKEVTGKHATQGVDASRPLYGIEPKGGRRNLLTYSEDISNAAWQKTGILSVATNAATAPDGTNAANLVKEDTSNGPHRIFQAVSLATATHTLSFYAKPAGRNWLYIYANAGTQTAFVNIATGALGTLWGSPGVVATSVGNGWYRVSVSFPNTTTGGQNLQIWTATADAVSSYAGDGTSGIYIWGAQLELGSTATNYQRVTTAFDVTEAGVNSCHYCQYDGSDDGMVTNSIDFTATDKMSVFAGVRKLSDAAIGVVAELNTGAGNGVFFLAAPRAPAGNYGFFSKGTVGADAEAGTTFAAPISNVLTGLGDIIGDRVTLRANGVQVAQTTTDQGTGNYGNHPLYIGRRGGSSLPFNGRDYGILVTGKLANATAIATTEMYLANKTPGVTL